MTAPRRPFRFTLRTLFVVVTVLGVWLGYQLQAVRERARLMYWIEDHGGIVNRLKAPTPVTAWPPGRGLLIESDIVLQVLIENRDRNIWLPYGLSRSTGGPVCDETGGKFGPFVDQMFVGDVGYGANPGIMRVALEKVDGEYQGACFRFVDNQPHGCVRMKFGPDNQLYMASLTTGLTRMKWDGTVPLAIQAVNIRPGGKGFVLKFTRPLAADTRLAAEDFRVKRYHYLYTGNYGSPEADMTNVPVEQAELAGDRQSIILSLPVETYPIGMVYEINAGKLTSDSGEPLQHNEAWYTVHRIPQ